MRTVVECDHYTNRDRADVPYLCESVIDGGDGTLTVFAVNRSVNDEMMLEVLLENYGNYEIVSHTELYSDDLKAANTADCESVKAEEREVKPGAKAVLLKKHSWNMIKVKYAKM